MNFKNEFSKEKVKYIQNNPNLGSAKTRNKGIEAADGKYITFLDDDDIYFPEKIKNQYVFMEENGLDYSVTDLDLYFDNEKLFERKTRKINRRIQNFYGAGFRALNNTNTAVIKLSRYGGVFYIHTNRFGEVTAIFHRNA